MKLFNKITGGTTDLLEKALDASWLRNDTISQNIANVDTPGYKRKTVSFEDQLDQAVDSRIKGRRTNIRHLPLGKRSIDDIPISIRKDHTSLSTRLDGNNVDIDNEMVAMAKNSIKYNLLIQSINGGFQRIISVINEGRR